MKKKALYIASLCLILSGCSSGISQEQYESVSAMASSLESEKDALTIEKESLAAENKSLTQKYGKLMDEKSNQVTEELDNSYARAWLTTSFGDNSVCLLGDSTYLQCISGKTYSITKEGVTEIYNDLLSSLATLAYVQNNIKYDSISIKFLDNSNTHIMDIVLKKIDGSFELDSILCNATHTSEIIPALNNL